MMMGEFVMMEFESQRGALILWRRQKLMLTSICLDIKDSSE